MNSSASLNTHVRNVFHTTFSLIWAARHPENLSDIHQLIIDGFDFDVPCPKYILYNLYIISSYTILQYPLIQLHGRTHRTKTDTVCGVEVKNEEWLAARTSVGNTMQIPINFRKKGLMCFMSLLRSQPQSAILALDWERTIS